MEEKGSNSEEKVDEFINYLTDIMNNLPIKYKNLGNSENTSQPKDRNENKNKNVIKSKKKKKQGEGEVRDKGKKLLISKSEEELIPSKRSKKGLKSGKKEGRESLSLLEMEDRLRDKMNTLKMSNSTPSLKKKKNAKNKKASTKEEEEDKEKNHKKAEKETKKKSIEETIETIETSETSERKEFNKKKVSALKMENKRKLKEMIKKKKIKAHNKLNLNNKSTLPASYD